MISKKQYEKLAIILIKLKKNAYYSKQLCEYSDEYIVNNVMKVYDSLEVTTKKVLLENLELVIDTTVTGKENVEESLIDILDVDKLSENHDRGLELNGKKWYIEMTSGTSGRPFPIIKSPHEKCVEAAYLLKCRKKIYARTSFENSFMLIHPIDDVLKKISHRGYKEDSFEKILVYMEEKRPKWIFTGVNLLTFLGDYVIATNQIERLQNIGVEFIETTSQKMDGNEKRKYEELFSARIVNNYGCREVWNIAYECSQGKMHINTEYLIVDIVDNNGKRIQEEGGTGNVILTSLSNIDMPLIKYAIGDRARISIEECSCGCSGPIIYLEESRLEERIEGTERNGTAVFRKILRRLYFHDRIRDIEAIKIIQDDVYHFTIYIIKKCIHSAERFEKLFIEQAAKNIGNIERYKFDFKYEYPFTDLNYMESEKIFKNVVNHRTENKE